VRTQTFPEDEYDKQKETVVKKQRQDFHVAPQETKTISSSLISTVRLPSIITNEHQPIQHSNIPKHAFEQLPTIDPKRDNHKQLGQQAWRRGGDPLHHRNQTQTYILIRYQGNSYGPNKEFMYTSEFQPYSSNTSSFQTTQKDLSHQLSQFMDKQSVTGPSVKEENSVTLLNSKLRKCQEEL